MPLCPHAGFPQGLNQDVGESGSMLSGGQRARVSLARSVYAQAQVTVLDDPLCALDSQLRAQVSCGRYQWIVCTFILFSLWYRLTGCNINSLTQVFKDCIDKGGLLRGKDRTVLMVSSVPTHHEGCDMVLALAVSVED